MKQIYITQHGITNEGLYGKINSLQSPVYTKYKKSPKSSEPERPIIHCVYFMMLYAYWKQWTKITLIHFFAHEAF